MKEDILNGAAALGVPLDDAQADMLIKYYNILIERNRVLNLTRITEPRDVIAKHFLDSLTPLLTGHVCGRVIDIGTGAGFPGLVLKCAAPKIELTLLDALNKRVRFLKDAAAAMGVSAEFIHARAEDMPAAQREKFDTVVSRAVANMRTLSEWCIPYVKPGGYFLALKGPLAGSELDDARAAIKILGGEVLEIFNAHIPHTALDHKIIVVKKVRHTPSKFPRRGGKAASIPIEKAI